MPRFKHDCEDCRFVGNFENEGQVADGYVCTVTHSIILRNGDNPPNYSSVPGFVLRVRDLMQEPSLERFREVFAKFQTLGNS